MTAYVEIVESTNLRLEKLLPTMEDTGAIDAAVVLMTREGQVQEAMSRLIKHLGTIESAFRGLFGNEDSRLDAESFQSSAEDLIQALQKYIMVGIWLCQGQTKMAREGNSSRRRQRSPTKDALTADENFWLELIETSVQLTRSLSTLVEARSQDTSSQQDAASHDGTGEQEPRYRSAAEPPSVTCSEHIHGSPFLDFCPIDAEKCQDLGS